MRRSSTVPGAVAVLGILALLNCSSSTDSDSDFSAPPTPTGLAFENNTISNGAASLFWDAVRAKDLSGYHVWWSTGTSVDTTTAEKRFVTGTAAVIDGLDYFTQYAFAVSAIDRSNNESPLSPAISGIPANTTGPRPPEGVNAVGQNTTGPQVTVYWQANGERDVDHYNIYRAIGQFPDTPFRSVSTTSFTDTTVEPGILYSYAVTAVDRGGWESDKSPSTSDLAMLPVSLVSPVDYAYVGEKPVFSWEPVDNAVKYFIVVTENQIGGELWKKELPASTTEVTYQGPRLRKGNTYYWRLGAVSKTEINSISQLEAFVVQ